MLTVALPRPYAFLAVWCAADEQSADAAIAANVEITALDNHFFFNEPPIWFTYFWGKGKAAGLARGLRNAPDVQKAAHP
jgi:hypothetical protein